ncbi:hypothetical protein WM46_15475 [Citrobacter freundii complex sp. CFNIH2]|uniref:ATP-binding cassette domain-containing protein n=1 Tax=Citrobacter freundii complex sp. CFNIH2 TaxID=2066049 RepID=UPI000C86D0E0|nr:ATP-binding cassette domain-containing protein [Citrobacter freundii complex sp. CFNIH2]AUO66038.1 hypothetical protein WM46_15475 [Citrobacter freundii complex sp. CFNIH2]
MRTVAELRNVYRIHHHADQSQNVLENICIKIEAGEMLAITGPSGAGKSSLMNLIGCLDYPSRGECIIQGHSITELHPDDLARLRQIHVGFVFQKYHLIPELDALSNTALPAVYTLQGRQARLSRAADLLRRLGLAEHLHHHPDEMSGGQQQRVCIARALMNGAEIILADEPTGALDTAAGEEVMAILEELHHLGHTVIIVTHDDQIAARAPRIIKLHDGRIVADSGVPVIHASRKHFHNPRTSHWRNLYVRMCEAFMMALHSMKSRRLRTTVTMCGMVFGIAAVVMVTAAGSGARQQTLQQLRNLSPGVVQLISGPGLFEEKIAGNPITQEDMEVLARLPGVRAISPQFLSSGKVSFRQKSNDALLQGVGPEYFRIHALPILDGILFPGETDQSAVIDESTQHALFDASGSTAIGKIIYVKGVPVRVVGVIPDNIYSRPGQVSVWLPWQTMIVRIIGQQPLQNVDIQLQENIHRSSTMQAVKSLISQRHNGRHDFTLIDNDRTRQQILHTAWIFNLLILIVAGVALGIGYLGVMNIMLVTVSERTREIGLRMAVGARRGDIMSQFMAEALLVSLAGGLLGLLLSAVLGPVMTNLVGSQLILLFSWQSAVLAFFCALLTGIVFGWLPARRAARMEPVQALAGE